MNEENRIIIFEETMGRLLRSGDCRQPDILDLALPAKATVHRIAISSSSSSCTSSTPPAPRSLRQEEHCSRPEPHLRLFFDCRIPSQRPAAFSAETDEQGDDPAGQHSDRLLLPLLGSWIISAKAQQNVHLLTVVGASLRHYLALWEGLVKR
jgi:hypothetical protein